MRIVVTGAASGIGRDIALDRAKHGDCVTILDRDSGALRKVQYAMSSACEKAITCDLASDAIEQSLTASFGDSLGSTTKPIDSLIHCAGVGGWCDLQDLTLEHWNALLNSNVRGAVFLTKVLLPRLLSPGGSIIFVASDSAVRGFGRRTTYCASKAALVGFSNALREELRPMGIRVTTLMPGRVDTAFNGGTPGQKPDAAQPGDIANAVDLVLRAKAGTDFPEITISSLRYPFGV